MGNKLAKCMPIRQRKSIKVSEDKDRAPETDQKNEDSVLPENEEADGLVQPPKLIYVGLYDFSGRTEGDLSFIKGDHIQVLNNADGDWWHGKCLRTDATGYVPSNYVEPLSSLRSYG